MSRDSKQTARWVTTVMAFGLVYSSVAQADKPPKDEEGVAYTQIALSNTKGCAGAVNQLAGSVEVVGRLLGTTGDGEVPGAHYWMVGPTGNVLVSMELQSLPPAEPDAVVSVVSSQAYDVSNQGIVVGYQRDDWGPPRPVLWPDGVSAPVELPLPEVTALGAWATSINDEGVVVGTMFTPTGQSLVAWKVAVVDGVAIVLDTQVILSAPNVYPSRVVNSGYVSATIADRAFRLRLDWDAEEVWEVAGSRTQLFDIYSSASGINEAGTVCGEYNDGASWAFVMTVAGDLLELPELPGGRLRGQAYEIRNKNANALNNASPLQVVGSANIVITETSEWRGTVHVLWDVGVDPSVIPTEETAGLYDINDASWIVGAALDADGVPVPVVLIPN